MLKKQLVGLTVLCLLALSGAFFWYESTQTFTDQENKDYFLLELETFYPDLFKLRSTKTPDTYKLLGTIESDTMFAKGKKIPTIAEDMTPQGLTIAGDYLVISAYSKSHTYNSVLWLLDLKTGAYIKSIILPNTDHIGGLAYDPKHQRLWMTTVEPDWSDSTISSLTLEQLNNYQFSQTQSVINYEEVYDLEDVKRASYMTYYDNQLFVGYFTKKGEGHLSAYQLEENGFPTENGAWYADSAAELTIATPKEIQGMAFYNGKLVLSQSYGSKDSKLLVYDNMTPDKLSDLTDEGVSQKLVAPPYLEQIWAHNGELYLLHEASASAYRNNPNIVLADYIFKIILK